MSEDRPHIVLVGSGGAPLREYLLQDLATIARITLLTPSAVTWQRPYVSNVIEHILSASNVDEIVRELRSTNPDGVVTWDETLLEFAGLLTERLGLRGLTAEAAHLCRDKAAQRRRLAEHGVPSARHGLARTAMDALDIATTIGFPVIVKPQALAGSIAVEKVDSVQRLNEAFDSAVQASFPGFDSPKGAVVEEFLVGDELSVDVWVMDGHAEPIVVAKKTVSAPPYFEEVRHEAGLDVLTLPEDLFEVVQNAVRALNLDRMVAHVEVMVTSTGCRIVEVNGRLGGDLIPYLGSLATGVQPGAIAGLVAAGIRPSPAVAGGQRAACAGIQFVYPAHDLLFEGLDVDSFLVDAEWCDSVRVLAPLGMEAHLPPRGFLARLACVVVTAESAAQLNERLDIAAQGVHPRGRAL